ncbi:Beta-N-acetylhexosaminidase [Thalassoporum mexicanum PCC 7367]|uniref:glycoside hydrolase family 3 N-terminal domain-containing protein n=1 Tax=Thalassoporum mexicanum TaxID=3457544 RepID=UPI00029FDB31|nr:glycoside hydrolase family 3 N-terminal domain-containing protein [Pseudanabaena sp. PCC 7367]AFY70932.1 Beta-N-acetylhexosaminidase [Pseudanabaena sp. PCC 7367]
MKKLPDFNSLTLREQVAQMVVVRASGHLWDHQIEYPQWEAPNRELQAWLAEGVGGVILVGGSAAEVWTRSQQLQAWAKLPLLIAADLEEGVGQRFAGATWFPPPMALQSLPPETAKQYASEMGRITAQEAAALGINWLFAPVVDVNNNPANPVINVRAFGESSADVIALSGAFIEGAKNNNVLTTAKHFPGHGDTEVDSHLQTPKLNLDRQRFNQVELPPFVAAIAKGVDSIMSAHIFAPVLDAQNIATLSPKILDKLLRQELGFDGLIVTDALVMGGVADRYDPAFVAVNAVLAGADILLMPVDPIVTIEAVCRAVEAGEIPRDRILASLTRIWQAKQRVCSPEIPSFEQLTDEVGSAANLDMARQIAQGSIRMCPGNLNLDRAEPPLNLLIVDDQLGCSKYINRRSPAITEFQAYGCEHLLVDWRSLAALDLQDLPALILQVFSRGNPYRGSAGMGDRTEALIEQLVNEDKLIAVLVYGSPYNLDLILPKLPPSIPWAFSYGQQPIAQAVLIAALQTGK